MRETDVLVIGGGAAALSAAAITAREKGASVRLLECAPRHFRGGNSRHTRNMRLVHETQHPLYTGLYPEEEMWANYMKATGGTAASICWRWPSTGPRRSSSGCRPTGCTSSRRSPGRCTWRAPMPGSWAAASPW